jgi:hypothetical protein
MLCRLRGRGSLGRSFSTGTTATRSTAGRAAGRCATCGGALPWQLLLRRLSHWRPQWQRRRRSAADWQHRCSSLCCHPQVRCDAWVAVCHAKILLRCDRLTVLCSSGRQQLPLQLPAADFCRGWAASCCRASVQRSRLLAQPPAAWRRRRACCWQQRLWQLGSSGYGCWKPASSRARGHHHVTCEAQYDQGCSNVSCRWRQQPCDSSTACIGLRTTMSVRVKRL